MSFRLDSALHPPLPPSRSGVLPVSHGHSIYWEEVGNPSAPPLVVLHGGPGGGINPYYRQLADPKRWRCILFEQRGCGRSTPFGGLEHNTTADLVADLEALRQHLGIRTWTVLGGSWGSTLGLAYAQQHAESCAGLVVSGIFLARNEDIEWWWNGARAIYPELWQALNDFLPEAERGQLRASYLKRILDPDPAVHVPALKSMLTYETQTLDVFPNWGRLGGLMDSPNIVAMGRLYAHYEMNRHFLTEGQLIENARRLHTIPGWIISGRFDACTPPSGAYDLSRAWPQARLRIMPASGHVWNDPILSFAIAEALSDLHPDRLVART